MKSSALYIIHTNQQIFTRYAEISTVFLVLKTPLKILGAGLNDILNDKGPFLKIWKFSKPYTTLLTKINESIIGGIEMLVELDMATIEYYTNIGTAFC